MTCEAIPGPLAQIAGSYRRKKEIVRDLFIISTTKAAEIFRDFLRHPSG
jgi:DNA polymerase/3'-5' exonuclease PolX